MFFPLEARLSKGANCHFSVAPAAVLAATQAAGTLFSFWPLELELGCRGSCGPTWPRLVCLLCAFWMILCANSTLVVVRVRLQKAHRRLSPEKKCTLLQGGVRISTEPLRSSKYYKYHTLTAFNHRHTKTKMFQLRGFCELTASPEDTASESQLLIGQ